MSTVGSDLMENAVSSQPAAVPAARSLAYLMSQYPMLSMIFVLREVLQLREMGFHIDVASINNPDRPPEQMTAEERTEASKAYHLRSHAAADGVAGHIRTLITRPRGYFRGIRLLVRLGGTDLRKLILHFMYFSEALMVGVWMRRLGHRHLHVHLASQAATVGMYVRHIFDVGYSLTVHGPDEFYDAYGQHLEEKIKAADFICCISHFARSQMMKFSERSQWSKFVVSRLGVDPSIFSPRPMRVSPDVFELLCVGRLTSAKGQHLLIEAVGRLARQGRRLRLRLVGSGPDDASLRAQAEELDSPDLVVFEGAVNQDHIRKLYGAADIFCIASVAEGIPVVLMEAMAMQIACVTTHITGIPELIRNGCDGLLVAPSDVDGMVKALAQLMDDPELRDRLGRSARARVLQHYDLRRSVEKLGAIFAERVVTDRHGSAV